jgi:hypothetical protein
MTLGYLLEVYAGKFTNKPHVFFPKTLISNDYARAVLGNSNAVIQNLTRTFIDVLFNLLNNIFIGPRWCSDGFT